MYVCMLCNYGMLSASLHICLPFCENVSLFTACALAFSIQCHVARQREWVGLKYRTHMPRSCTVTVVSFAITFVILFVITYRFVIIFLVCSYNSIRLPV